MSNDYKFDTLSVMGGFHSDVSTGATNVPIYLSNAYDFPSADSAAARFALKEAGYIYTRLNNPTVSVLEERVTLLEGGVASVATSSGQFAATMAFLAVCEQGDEIIAADNIYGGSINLLSVSLQKLGIKVKFVNQYNISEFENAITDKTKAVFIESISNPKVDIPDFEAIASIAKKHSILLVVDNTMATPYLCRPVEYGANVIIHSATKYLCGNGSVMGGVVVDLGNFDWNATNRYESFCKPDISYHGLEFVKAFGQAALAAKMRCCVLRDLGGAISPFNAFMIIQSIQTLSLRMAKHVDNTMLLLDFLLSSPFVESVSHPSLASHPSYKYGKKYFSKGAGGLLNFRIKGGHDKAKKFIDNLSLCVHASNVGDSRTIVTHPAGTTHSQCSKEELNALGITDDLIRVCVGLEDISDIIQDFKKAFEKN